MRCLLRGLLGESAEKIDTLTRPDGAPSLSGGSGLYASLSHLDGYVCAALSTRAIAVDLCSYRQRTTASRILTRAGVAGECMDPAAQWVAIECAVKLRGGSVLDLLDECPQIEEQDGRFRVLGFGEPVFVAIETETTYLRGVAA
ncbi:MAG: hypothetical protein GY811_23250 [Myxococcales bacterium]|nr:hypothetical protein [Myxococcales bacterium]